MEIVSVGRRRYSDPDVLSLIRATGQLVDPRSAVLTQARKLNEEYSKWDGDFSDPIKRLTIMASLRGLRVEAMDATQALKERRDAVVMPVLDGTKGKILFNPTRPRARVAFSIAHEIAHIFFPNSVKGARFRSICAPGSREARELEGLCDLAASELLMPSVEFLKATAGEMGLHLVARTSAEFGSSYEATVFRFATAYPGLAVAGLLRYRLTVGEERSLAAKSGQSTLFGLERGRENAAQPKYRRQSFFTSDLCDADEHIVRWNKSFDIDSCVYKAAIEDKICRGIEHLPNEAELAGRIEAIPAPYQRPEADPNHPDVLFLWWTS